MRRSVVVAVVLLALAVVLVGGPSLFTAPSTSEVAPEAEAEPDPDMVTLEGSDSSFWIYLNARPAFEKRSPVNVIVRGDADEVVRLMTEDGGNWEEADDEHADAAPETHAVVPANESDGSGNESTVGNGTAATNGTDDAENRSAIHDNESIDTVAVGSTEISWARATGSTRYAYVDPGDGEEGRWVEETMQLHDGAYYGHRYHIRLYESPNPDDRWVAMQTHTEHFDWFTLTHRVDGTEAAQSRLEADFMALPQVDQREDVSRIYLDNGGPSDANGWATLVDLVGAAVTVVLAGVAAGPAVGKRASDRVDERLTETDRRRIDAARDRVDARHLLLVGTILAIVLGVRIGGIALERRAGFLSMHAIAALLYPFIGLGLPIATYRLASGLDRRLDAAAVASGALSVAIWLDYGLLGVDSLPIDVVVQRMLVVVALGLIAGGATRRARGDGRLNAMLVAGASAWVLVLVGTLFGYL